MRRIDSRWILISGSVLSLLLAGGCGGGQVKEEPAETSADAGAGERREREDCSEGRSAGVPAE